MFENCDAGMMASPARVVKRVDDAIEKNSHDVFIIYKLRMERDPGNMTTQDGPTDIKIFGEKVYCDSLGTVSGI